MASSAPIVQYVVVRGDLIKSLAWPLGALIAQACHASTAVIHKFYQDEHTQSYLEDLDNMHKIILEATDEKDLIELEVKLTKSGIDHKIWIEQPENYATCLAVKPYPKTQVQKYFKKFKLYKGPPLQVSVQTPSAE